MIACFLFVLSFVTQFMTNSGFAHIAISSHLQSNQQVTQSDWLKLTAWSTSLNYGHTTSSVVFTNGEFHATYSGLYNVFTTVTFSGAQTGVFKVALVVNDNSTEQHPGLESSFEDAVGYRSVSVYGTIRLFSGDRLAVYVYSERDADYMLMGDSESTFCLEFVGYYNQVPGFSSAMSHEQTFDVNKIGKWHRLLGWQTTGRPGFFNSHTGFSDDVGELVASCDGVYQISANVGIFAYFSGNYSIALAFNDKLDGSTTSILLGDDVTNSIVTLTMSVAYKMIKGDKITIFCRGEKKFKITMQSGYFGILMNKGGDIPGVSTVFTEDISKKGGTWINIPFTKPTSSRAGQFEAPENSVNGGRFYHSTTQIFTITATINVVSPSSTSLALSLQNDASSFSGLKTGLFSTNQRSSQRSSYTVAGILQLSANQPLFMFIHLSSQEQYVVLAGSRVSVAMVQQSYEAFNVVLDQPIPYSGRQEEWIRIDTWKVGDKSDSFSFTNQFDGSLYIAPVSGVYFFTANVIFLDSQGPISVIVSVDGSLSKRNSLFVTNGHPGSIEHSLSIAGSMFVEKGLAVSVHIKIEEDPDFSVDRDSSFSAVFLGYPATTPGFSTVLQNSVDIKQVGWSLVRNWRVQKSVGEGAMYDVGGAFTPSTGVFVAPKPGFYIASSGLKLIKASWKGSAFTLNIAKNGAPGRTQYENALQDYVENSADPPPTDFYSLLVSGVIQLDQGDALACYVRSTGDDSYTFSQDSYFSVTFVGDVDRLLSSAMQAMLNPVINQQQTGSYWLKVKNWETKRSNTAPGLFKTGNLMQLASNDGTVKIVESGIYIIFVNMAVGNADKRLKLAVHNSRSGATSLYTRYAEVTRKRYTMHMFSALYLCAGQTMSVKIMPKESTASWENLREYSGWSMVRLPMYMRLPALRARKNAVDKINVMQQITLQHWSRINNWHLHTPSSFGVQDTPFDWNKGVYTVEEGGIYIVSSVVHIQTNESQVSITSKIGVDGDNSKTGANTIDSGDGASYVLPLCVIECTLRNTLAVMLQRGQTVAVFLQSNAQTTFVSALSRFSLKLVLPSAPLVDGFSARIESTKRIVGSGNKIITGWGTPESIYYRQSQTIDQYSVLQPGVYLASLNLELFELEGVVNIGLYMDTSSTTELTYHHPSKRQFTLSLVNMIKLNPGDTYLTKINSEVDSSYSLSQQSTSSLTFLGTNQAPGFSAAQIEDNANTYAKDSWYPVIGWTVFGSSYLFHSGDGFSTLSYFVAHAPGFYFIAANLLFDTVAKNTNVEVQLLRNQLTRNTEFVERKELSNSYVTTLSIVGGLFLNNFDQLKLEMKFDRTVENVVLKKASTFSVVRIGNDWMSSSCIDNGPRMIGELTVGNTRLGHGEQVTWQCFAVAKGNVKYQWTRDFKPIAGATNVEYKISSTGTLDTGKYVCTVTYEGVKVSGNVADIIVYDAYPAFLNPEEEYNITVEENGEQVADLLEIDAVTQSFESNYDEMEFSIVEGTDLSIFALEPLRSISGTTLKRLESFDREKISHYQFKIQAMNRMRKEFKRWQTIHIFVKDVNDNSPKFNQTSYKASVSEGAESGTKIAQVTAVDPDTGVNAQVEYSILPLAHSDIFTVDASSGVVRLAGGLDRETKHSYNVIIKASNVDAAVSAAFAQLVVNVADVNEFAPEWSVDVYNIDVAETVTIGMHIKQLLASDKDAGVNAQIIYTIVSGNKPPSFEISSTGMLRTIAYLDYEAEPTYDLRVSIRDNGTPPKEGAKEAIVNVFVQNSNDNKPVFGRPEYTAYIPENTGVFNPSFFVKANDQDQGSMKYNIPAYHNISNVFTIGELSGQISIKKPLDYEHVTFYQFTVEAVDSGVPPEVAKTNVLVRVIDVNDNIPRFTKFSDTVSVKETSSVGLVIYLVEATDDDTSESNNQIVYEIKSGNDDDTFYINSRTGDVTTQKPVDREKKDSYTLKISARDTGDPSLVSADDFELRVTVTDENDSEPKFDLQEYEAKVSEDVAVDSVLVVFKVTDADIDENAQFDVSILETSMNDLFQVRNKERSPGVYEVVLLKELDYEDKNIYRFTLFAQDRGTPARSNKAAVLVTVFEVNDNAPTFEKESFTATLSDTTIPDQKVFQLFATDPDAGPENKLTYTIVSGNEDEAFELLKHSGFIVAKPRDGFTFKPQYQLQVTAQDSYVPPKVSQPVTVFVRVTSIPEVLLEETLIGRTEFMTVVSLTHFAHLVDAEKLEILVQRYQPTVPSFAVYAREKVSNWWKVMKSEQDSAKYLRYTAFKYSLPLPKRKRRSVISVGEKLKIVVGENTTCSQIESETVCNGPLVTTDTYRLQLRVYDKDNTAPLESHFSLPIQMPDSTNAENAALLESAEDGMIALAGAFACICLLALLVVFVYLCWKQRHELLHDEHLRGDMASPSLYDRSDKPENPNTFYSPARDERFRRESSRVDRENQGYDGEDTLNDKTEDDSRMTDITITRNGSPPIGETEPSDNLYALADEISRQDERKRLEMQRKQSSFFDIVQQAKIKDASKRFVQQGEQKKQAQANKNNDSSIEYESISSRADNNKQRNDEDDDDESILL